MAEGLNPPILYILYIVSIMVRYRTTGGFHMANVDQYISVTQAKAQLLDLVRQLHKHQNTVAITRDGVPTAVLLSMEYFEGLIETLEILSDQKTIRRLRRSLKEAQTGQWVTESAAFDHEKS